MDNYSCPKYGYNSNGAMIYDVNKGISRIDYDQFGTPRRVQFANHSITEYVYAADGRRLKTRHRTSVPRSDMLGIYQTATLPSSETLSVDSTEYIGSYVCTNGQARRYNFDGGYLMLYNNIAIPRYYIKDHLGSNRMIVSSIGYINQSNIYYALGGTTALSSGQEYQQYKYTDKEYDPMHGLNLYDYGARQYDPAIGRFTSIDPLAEKYYHLTPYSYCGGDPVNRVDLNGDSIIVNIDDENLFYNNMGLYYSDGSLFKGNAKFAKKLLKAFDVISSTEIGSHLIHELSESKNIFQIRPYSESKYLSRTNNPYYSRSDVIENSGGGIICWNVSGTEIFTERGRSYNATIDLAHEMFHALDLDKGRITDNRYLGISINEWNALYNENILREQLNLPLRTYYRTTIDDLGTKQPFEPFLLDKNRKTIIPIR